MHPGFPTTPVLDNFHRADGPLGSGNWGDLTASAPLQISGNLAVGAGASQWVVEQFLFAEVFATLAGLATSGKQGVDTGVTAAASPGYRIEFVPTEGTRIGFSGASYLIQGLQIPWAVGDGMGIRVWGRTVEGWRKPSGGTWGRIVAVPIPASPAFAQKRGFIGLNTGANGAFSDFGGGAYEPPRWGALA